MKKVLSIVLVLSLVFSLAVFAKNSSKDFEDAVTGKNVDWAKQNSILTVNPVGLIFGYIYANYETAMGEDNGLGFSAGLIFKNVGVWSEFGASVGASYNWYFQHHALNGWFAGPAAGIGITSINYEYTYPYYDSTTLTWIEVKKKESASVFGLSIGGHGGYRWIWKNGFVLDVTAGLSFTISGGTTLHGVAAPFGGADFGPGVNLGYAW